MLLFRTLALFFSATIRFALCSDIQPIHISSSETKNSSNSFAPLIKIEKEDPLGLVKYNKTEGNVLNNATTISNYNAVIKHENNDHLLQSGAFMRGVYVILGITVILIGYIAYKVLRNGRVSSTSRIRKYGVLANRSDVEMLPLPLTDDEDDDTVFALNNQTGK